MSFTKMLKNGGIKLNSMKDLTNSLIDRQNILNNQYAMNEIEKEIGFKGILFENEYKFVKSQIAEFYEVDERTIDRLLEQNRIELENNGYYVLKGAKLKDFTSLVEENLFADYNISNRTRNLGLFNFRSFLNIGMLLTESEKAKELRSSILDIVIDTINFKTGGSTKYINQRDEEFIYSMFKEENYRKSFTDALNEYVDMGKSKYPIYTNKIYYSIFREKAIEYRKILKLSKKDKTRDTFYSEVLDIVSSYEYGLGEKIKSESISFNRKLSSIEVDKIFNRFESEPHWVPLIEKARVKMASRDLVFRDALHKQLESYIQPLNKEEFERFLGEKSKELAERLEESKDVLKRLKERE